MADIPRVTSDTGDTGHGGIFAAKCTAGESYCEVQAGAFGGHSRFNPGLKGRSVPRPQTTSRHRRCF
jgi:hypothetical protein